MRPTVQRSCVELCYPVDIYLVDSTVTVVILYVCSPALSLYLVYFCVVKFQITLTFIIIIIYVCFDAECSLALVGWVTGKTVNDGLLVQRVN